MGGGEAKGFSEFFCFFLDQMVPPPPHCTSADMNKVQTVEGGGGEVLN